MTLYEISALICAASSVAFAAGVWRVLGVSLKDTSEIPPLTSGQQSLPVPGQQFYLEGVPEPVTVTGIEEMVDAPHHICYSTDKGVRAEVSAPVFMSLVREPPAKPKPIPMVGQKYSLKGVPEIVEIVDTKWDSSQQFWSVWYCIGPGSSRYYSSWHNFRSNIENDCTY